MADPLIEGEIPVSYRRYCLLKRQAWIAFDNSAMAGVWRSYQESQPGNALPVTFPFLATLEAGGYTCREDLLGATVTELVRFAGLKRGAAVFVLDSFAALPPLP